MQQGASGAQQWNAPLQLCTRHWGQRDGQPAAQRWLPVIGALHVCAAGCQQADAGSGRQAGGLSRLHCPRLMSYCSIQLAQGGYKYHQYQVVGRHLPTIRDPEPTIYRMKLWASDPVRAKSKFWCAAPFPLSWVAAAGWWQRAGKPRAGGAVAIGLRAEYGGEGQGRVRQ